MQKYPAKRVILLYLAITAVWAAYRYFFVLPELVDEYIAKPIIDLLPILYIVFTVEKNTFESLGLTRNKYLTYALMGVGLGGLLIFESVLTKYIRFGGVHMVPGPFPILSYIVNLLVAFGTAFTEETVFRGYFFRRIMWVWDNEIIANVLSTTFFTVAHLPVAIFLYHYGGVDLLVYCFQIYVLGTIFAFTFARVDSIVPSTIAHTLWNFANVFIH